MQRTQGMQRVQNMLKDLYTGDRIKLTGPAEGDAAAFEQWGRDSEFMRLIDTGIAHPSYARLLQDETSPADFEFRIRLLDSNKLIGFVGVHDIQWNNQTGVLGIGIGSPEHRSHGYGSEALNLMLQFAFEELNLHRVTLYSISYNERALKTYEKAGFTEEGRLRQAIYRDGVRYDQVYMGILRHEWESLNL